MNIYNVKLLIIFYYTLSLITLSLIELYYIIGIFCKCWLCELFQNSTYSHANPTFFFS